MRRAPSQVDQASHRANGVLTLASPFWTLCGTLWTLWDRQLRICIHRSRKVLKKYLKETWSEFSRVLVAPIAVLLKDDAGRGSRASYVESSEAGDATDVNRDGDEFVGEQFLQVQSPRLPSPPRVTV
jgi:hypothetical protein